jgi:beta-lactamase regulating signal transducer with metallopeptidase domain
MSVVAIGSQVALLQPLGWTLIHFLWQGLALAALLCIAIAGLKSTSSNARYMAGCVALFLMGLAPLLTLRYELEVFRRSTIWNASLESQKSAKPIAYVDRSRRPVLDSATITPRPVPVHFVAPGSWTDRIIPWSVAGWMVGVFFLSTRLFATWIRVQLLRRAGHELIDETWLVKLVELQDRLGIRRKVALFKAAALESPAVIGWLRPVILVPASALSGLTPAQLEAILIHELSHILRHDYLVNLVQSSIEIVLFYHPAVWWVSNYIRQERENCCDDIAIQISGDRFDYARALTTLEHLRIEGTGLAISANGGSIGQRVRRIIGAPAAERFSITWVGGLFGLAVLVVSLFLSKGVLFAAGGSKAAPLTQSTNAVKASVLPTAVMKADGKRVVQNYPMDWPLVRSNLKNFITNSESLSLSAQLLEYFALRKIPLRLEDHFENISDGDSLDEICIPSAIDELVPTLVVRVSHSKMALFEESLRHLTASFDRIEIETKWVEVQDINEPANDFRGLLSGVTDATHVPHMEPNWTSSLSFKPCLGSAVSIQGLGDNKFQTNVILNKNAVSSSTLLSRKEYTNLIRAFEQRGGVDLLSAPRVTTLSGRQARVSVEDTLTIIVGMKTNALGEKVASPMQIPFGPTIDIFPELSDDKSQIQLRIVGRLNEFLGYWETNGLGKFEPVPPTGPRGLTPGPRFVEHLYDATDSLGIGETILLGGLTTETRIKTKDQVPVLGDIPLLGRLFRSESTSKRWRSVLIMVTPNLVNPYGDRARIE